MKRIVYKFAQLRAHNYYIQRIYMKIEIYSDRDIEPHRFNRLYTQFLQQNNGQIQNKIGIE